MEASLPPRELARRIAAQGWSRVPVVRGSLDDVAGLGTGDELLHVEDRGRVVHRAAGGHGHHRDGVVHALGRQRGAVDRVHGDVDLGALAVADLLAVVEHRGFVLLALPDDDDAVHRDGRDEGASLGKRRDCC